MQQSLPHSLLDVDHLINQDQHTTFIHMNTAAADLLTDLVGSQMLMRVLRAACDSRTFPKSL